MGPDINRSFLQGNLGQEPELRYTQAGQAVLNMRLATNEQWVDQQSGDLREKTEWHTIVVWGKRGEGLNKVLKKGMRLFIEGRNQTRSYEDKDTGKKVYVHEVVATDIKIQPTRRRTDAAETSSEGADGADEAASDDSSSPLPPADAPACEDAEIPF